jgi:sugar/nucleoside kinase (ribokinase family)
MACKSLIISSPTVDIINIDNNEKSCAGGPPLYTGFTLRKMDCDVYFFGPIGYETKKTVKIQEMLGINTLGIFQDVRGAVFYHKYEDNYRITKFIGEIKTINIDELKNMLSKTKYDILIISPIFNEIPPDYIKELHKPITLDPQGYTRALKNWTKLIPINNIDLIHLSNDDLSLNEIKNIELGNATLIYTMGMQNTIIISKNKKIEIKPKGNLVKDRTGAGDIITGLVSYYYLYEKRDILDSYYMAQKQFEKLIKEVSEIKYKINEM